MSFLDPIIFMKSKTSDAYDICEIHEQDYTSSNVLKTILLKIDDHIPSFAEIMKNFKIEMVLNDNVFFQFEIHQNFKN